MKIEFDMSEKFFRVYETQLVSRKIADKRGISLSALIANRKCNKIHERRENRFFFKFESRRVVRDFEDTLQGNLKIEKCTGLEALTTVADTTPI